MKIKVTNILSDRLFDLLGQPILNISLEFPQVTPWSRAPAQPLKNQDPGALLVISGGKTFLLLVAVQYQHWVQCRSLSLT